jgi:internalin A
MESNEIIKKIEIDQENSDKNEYEISIILDRLEYLKEEKLLLIKTSSDLTFIKNLPHGLLSDYVLGLYIDKIHYFNLLDLNFIEQFSQLNWLYIDFYLSRENIDNIESVRNLCNIEYLNLSHVNISDISPIGDLKNLKELKLNQLTQINDITFLNNLVNLQSLMIGGCDNIENYNPIGDLKNLTELTLGSKNENKIDDISFINSLENLKKLGIWWDIKNFNPIFELKNLQELELSNITQDFVNNLINLQQLKRLYIPRFNAEDFSPLLNLPNLVYIDFGYIPNDKLFLILPLASSNSLKEIYIDFGSPERSSNFRRNEGSIFSKNGINIDEPGDYR